MYSLYIHIPFCKKRCLYCDFTSISNQEILIPTYLEALYKEMCKYSNMALTTVFIGGGTPTLLSIEQFSELFCKIRKIFCCSNLSEITIEANPESLTIEKLRILKALGINRISLGAQSFLDDELLYLGRIHTVRNFKKAFCNARRLGFSNINIDMLYGLPNQTLLQWQENLETVISYQPEHISVYPLIIEPETSFAYRNLTISEEDQAMMYEWSQDFLSSNGYNHYEISTWAKAGFKCRHNLTYWQNEEYIGLGASAASYINGLRKKNCSNVNEYIKLIEIGANPIEEEDYISEEKQLGEEVMLKLHCREGVYLSKAIKQKYNSTINQLLDNNLLENSGENIRLTRRGLLLANQVMKEFV